MKELVWIFCPICKNKTRNKMREDTEIKNFPLYCPQQQFFRGGRGMSYLPVRYFTADTGIGAGTWFFPAGAKEP